METIKIGSKGNAVKTLQSKLGLVADGIFGQKTKDALVAFQKSKGLTADGIAGTKTWIALGVVTSTNPKCVDSSVTYSPLNTHISFKPGRNIKYIVIHYTAGRTSSQGSAINEKKVFEQSPASADFAVDDNAIIQFNPDVESYYCWAVGDVTNGSEGGASLKGKCMNTNSIHVEICSSLKSGFKPNFANHEGWMFTDKALQNAISLVRILMKKFNIPVSNVCRHYDVTGKLCPGIVGWNDGHVYTNFGKLTPDRNTSLKWLEFKASL